MKVDIIGVNEVTGDVRAAWRRLQLVDEQLGNPCFAPVFTEAVARSRSDVRVALLQSEGRIAGILPFQRNLLGIGKPVGGGMSDFNGIIGPVRMDMGGLSLCKACGIGYLDFYHMLSNQESFRPFHRRLVPAPHLDTAQGFELYKARIQQGGSRCIANIEAAERRLSRKAGPVRVEHDTHDEQVFNTLLKWKSEQFRRTGVGDIFTKRWVCDMVRELFRLNDPDCTGVLSGLWAGDRLVAAHFGIRSSAVLNYWLPAYSQDFASYSPGLILLLHLVSNAAQSGIRKIELGKGEAWYKTRLATGSTILAEGEVAPVSMASFARRSIDFTKRLMRYTLKRNLTTESPSATPIMESREITSDMESGS
jgi:CelD/BcsL family acetyltransferase involved in cellulose biosynthesis